MRDMKTLKELDSGYYDTSKIKKRLYPVRESLAIAGSGKDQCT